MGALLNKIISFLASVVAALLPHSDGFGVSFLQIMGQLMIYGKQYGFIIPWDAIFISFTVWIAFEFALLLFKILAWVITVVEGADL